MSNIIKVSTPVSGYENSSRTNPITTNDPNINNITNVSKVTRPDSKSSNTDYQQNNFVQYQNSNYEGFLKVLKDAPFTTELMGDLMFVKLGNLVNSGINENFAQEISRFLELIKLSPEELQGFLKNQVGGATKFGGAFFDFLRNVLAESNSGELNSKILDLLKKYNDFSASNHIVKNILIDLSNLSKSLPKSYSEQLLELTKQLDENAKPGDTTNNLEILKKEIIPFLSKYTRYTNDFGRVRDLISSLTQNISRYENANKNGFIDAFDEIMHYNVIKDKLGNIDSETFADVLMQLHGEKLRGDESNQRLINILERGIRGEAGYENIDGFKGILTSMLLNESVYMPLLHVMLPLDVNGNMMFSELWIDPDDEEGKNGEVEKKTKLLIKFDIKDVGFFDLIILHNKGKIDMQLFCPEKILSADKGIKAGLGEIMERNGLAVNSISIDKRNIPVSISEVFPKICERKNTVNVKI
ncbi:hypothetical protein CLNEO_25870 [Anaerotignum neopropionicum]|uniref:Flagellar hook-length control protein FliK n=1 Tax=Anaerotignum neopropionicum TaxID=36847 RepID=A0A136WC23_9FIRM|nr:hypothetical protein [Anaerotignum neopropionicum]KXL52071.1 hypothetical protein CLNEO_25870 [Anaerotignum neopropionicum]